MRFCSSSADSSESLPSCFSARIAQELLLLELLGRAVLRARSSSASFVSMMYLTTSIEASLRACAAVFVVSTKLSSAMSLSALLALLAMTLRLKSSPTSRSGTSHSCSTDSSPRMDDETELAADGVLEDVDVVLHGFSLVLVSLASCPKTMVRYQDLRTVMSRPSVVCSASPGTTLNERPS